MSKKTAPKFGFGPNLTGDEILERIERHRQFVANQESTPMFRHRLPGHLISEGCFMLAHECGLWLLIDTVLDNQITSALRTCDHQIWTMRPGKGRYATEFTVEDRAGKTIHWTGLPYPRLPMPELQVWYQRTGNVGGVMLPYESAMDPPQPEAAAA